MKSRAQFLSSLLTALSVVMITLGILVLGAKMAKANPPVQVCTICNVACTIMVGEDYCTFDNNTNGDGQPCDCVALPCICDAYYPKNDPLTLHCRCIVGAGGAGGS